MWRALGTKRYGKDDLTSRQRMLAASVRELLTAERVKFEERVQLNGEAVYAATPSAIVAGRRSCS